MKFHHRLAEMIFRHLFWLYRPLYFFFKNYSDAGEIGLLKKYVRPGSVVLDIGANIGFYARMLSEFAGRNGKVFCFEPDKKNFERLSSECKGLANVSIYNKAVGESSGRLKLYLSGDLNVDHRSYEPEKFSSVTEVESVSVDDLVISGGQVDFVKMDIQGFEEKALKGMKATLAKNHGIRMITEFWPYGLRRAGGSAASYFYSLDSMGFNCYLLKGNALQKLDAQKVMALQDLGEEHYFNIFVTREHVQKI
jgi:FkbM family methyltransferase